MKLSILVCCASFLSALAVATGAPPDSAAAQGSSNSATGSVTVGVPGNQTLPGNITVDPKLDPNGPPGGITIPVDAKRSYAEPAPTGAETEWGELESLWRKPRYGDSAGKNGEDLILAADRFKAFAAKYPDHVKVADAQCYEAILLLRAQLDGDTLNRGRVESAVARSIHDKAVTPTVRAELFALADTTSIVLQRGLKPKDILSAFEKASRKLIAEFPDLPNGYESLAGVANDSDDAEGAALAKEVASMAAAPAYVREAAQKSSARFDLNGKSLGTLLKGVPDATALLGDGKLPVFVYAWSVAAPGSLSRAGALAANVGGKATLVGVCLDTDVAAAKAAAASAKLPGTLIYDPAGPAGGIASLLKLSTPGMMYEADSKGTLVSTATHLRLTAKNAAAQ